LTPIFDRLAASVTAMFVLVLLLVLLLAVFLEDVMLGYPAAWAPLVLIRGHVLQGRARRGAE
jgi:hypothetical protein